MIAEDPSEGNLLEVPFTLTGVEKEYIKPEEIYIVTETNAAMAGVTPDLSTAEAVKRALDAGTGGPATVLQGFIDEFDTAANNTKPGAFACTDSALWLASRLAIGA